MNKKLLSLVMTGVLAVGVFSVATPYAVSYTHLDVYKRQDELCHIPWYRQ